MTSGLSAGRPSRTGSSAERTLRVLAGDEGTARVNFDIPKSKHRALKVYAASQGKSIKDLLTDYLDTLPLVDPER